jgi:hypothetical protein
MDGEVVAVITVSAGVLLAPGVKALVPVTKLVPVAGLVPPKVVAPPVCVPGALLGSRPPEVSMIKTVITPTAARPTSNVPMLLDSFSWLITHLDYGR